MVDSWNVGGIAAFGDLNYLSPRKSIPPSASTTTSSLATIKEVLERAQPSTNSGRQLAITITTMIRSLPTTSPTSRCLATSATTIGQ